MKYEVVHKQFTGIEWKKDKPGEFTAKIAQLNVIDNDGDVTLTGAFPEGKQVLISAYMHNSWEGALPIGKGVIRVDNDDVFVDGQLNLNSDTGKEHYETIKFAPELTEWSYGFKVLEVAENTEWNKNPAVWRVLAKVDPFEASPVLLGAGIDTRTVAIKSGKNGLPYSEEAEALLADAQSFIVRTKSLADLRRKEGREFSAANRERLTRIQKSLADATGEIETLLKDEQKPPEEDGKAALLRAMLTKSKIESEEILN
jgi:hypothetical protein